MKDLIRSNLAHSAGGFLLMGSWAAIANSGHAFPAPLQAGLVQGCLTAVITLFLKRMIEEIHRRSAKPLRTVLPPIAAFTISVTLLSSIHFLAGTPAILATILVPVTVSTIYAFLYAQGLTRHEP